MANNSLNMSAELAAYLRRISVRESDILARLRAETSHLEAAIMQISPEQGAFMAMLLGLVRAERALEVGVFTGYSALVTALALPERGHLTALDINEDWTRIARRYWDEAGAQDKIDLRLGPALHSMDELLGRGLAGTYDFAFIDADKVNYLGYYERALELVKADGLIAVDNVLWGGNVVDPEKNDADTKAIRELNEVMRDDTRISLCMVPIGDGLSLARKLP